MEWPDMIERYDIVIVGAGHGGTQAAIVLRQRGFAGSIALIGDEVELPYERPPLSKEYLAGEKPFGRILIRPESFWGERAITLLLGQRGIAVEPEAPRVALSDGTAIGSRTLIWATGGRPRRLSCAGHDLKGVHVVRARADVDTILDELDGSSRVAVIGGGYIGLEVAAVLNKLGKSVVVFEAQARVLSLVSLQMHTHYYEPNYRAPWFFFRT